VAALKLQVAWYEEQFRRAQQKRFGASSEQTHPDQLTLFNEAEAEADPKAPEPTVETVAVQRRKKAKGEREAKLATCRSKRSTTRWTKRKASARIAPGRCTR